MPLDGHPDLPPFPTSALPSVLREFVEAEAEATQTPPDLAAMLVLAVCAAAVAKRVEVHVRSGWSEPLNVFGVVALPPGNRKSAVFRAVAAPLMRREREEARELGPVVEDAKSRRRVAEARLAAAERAAAKDEGDDGLTEVDRISRQLRDMETPVPLRLVVSDCTPEKLVTLLAEHGGRMAALSPEGEVFELLAGRYQTANLEVFLKGHAGDDLRVDRVGREPEFVERPALTVGLAVQPDVLRGLVDKPGFRGRGLLARFMYALPESLLGRRSVNSTPVPRDVEVAYGTLVARLLGIPSSSDEFGDPAPHPLTLGDEARERHLRLQKWLEPRLAEFGELGSIADWASKLPGAVARIAGLLHLAEHANDVAPWQVEVSDATMENAISAGDYLLAHARAAFGLMGADPAVETARYVLGRIHQAGVDHLTRRDTFELVKGRLHRVSELDGPLRILVEHGYLRERPVERKGPGRPPSPIYDVNPNGHPDTPSQYSHNSQNSELGEAA